MSTPPHDTVTWRKASRSTATDTCVELAYLGAVRDSKNPAGPALHVDLVRLLTAAKTGGLDR